MARLEFIEKIPETIGMTGFVIILLVLLIGIVLFVIIRFLRRKKLLKDKEAKPGEANAEMKEKPEEKPAEHKEVKLERRLQKLKEKLEELDRIRRSEGKSPSEL